MGHCILEMKSLDGTYVFIAGTLRTPIDGDVFAKKKG